MQELKATGIDNEITFSMTPLMMVYLKYNNLEGNIDAVTPHDLCFQEYELNMSNIQAHEDILHKLESNNPTELQEYAISFLNNVNHGICFSNVIEEAIGVDIQGSRSWEIADLA